jgi:hypothetical protein
MQTYKTVILFLSLSLSLPAITQEPLNRELNSFERIVAGDRIIVRLVKADKESAIIKAQGIDASSVKSEVSNGTLTLSIYGQPFAKKKVMVTLNYVNLKSITITGGAEITTVSLFKADSLFVDIKSGGMLYLDADLDYLNCKVVEGGLLNAEGYATSQNIHVATSATVSSFNLESDTIKVRAVTGGKAKINVEKVLDAEASSKGYISFKGNPEKIDRIENTGGSIVVYQE